MGSHPFTNDPVGLVGFEVIVSKTVGSLLVKTTTWQLRWGLLVNGSCLCLWCWLAMVYGHSIRHTTASATKPFKQGWLNFASQLVDNLTPVVCIHSLRSNQSAGLPAGSSWVASRPGSCNWRSQSRTGESPISEWIPGDSKESHQLWTSSFTRN